MITRASGSGFSLEGSGPSETDIHDWIEAPVSAAVREMLPEMYRSIKTKLIALFDEWYPTFASIISAAATTSAGEMEMSYRQFSNTKPPIFYGVRDLIVVMRWISDVEGCFNTCACPSNMNFRYA